MKIVVLNSSQEIKDVKNMFKLSASTTEDIQKFRKYFENINEFIDEIKLTVNKDSIETQATDRSMVCALGFKMPMEVVMEGTLQSKTEIGFNVQNFVSFLKRLGKDEKFSIVCENNKLTIVGDSRKFTMGLLDLGEVDIPKINELKFDTKFDMLGHIFKQTIQDGFALKYDSIVIQTEQNKITFSCKGDISSFESEVSYNKIGLTKSKSHYPLDYLAKLNLNGNVTIEFSNNYPMKITSNGFWFVIAPRVSEDDEIIQEKDKNNKKKKEEIVEEKVEDEESEE